MTTDLTGGADLNEEDFDWDVFAPDPGEDEIAAEAAALEDRAELNLDDSHIDWEAALQEPETMGGADGDARAGAAFDRIVDTVRRSVEDPEAEKPRTPRQRRGLEAETRASTRWPRRRVQKRRRPGRRGPISTTSRTRITNWSPAPCSCPGPSRTSKCRRPPSLHSSREPTSTAIRRQTTMWRPGQSRT